VLPLVGKAMRARTNETRFRRNKRYSSAGPGGDMAWCTRQSLSLHSLTKRHTMKRYGVVEVEL